jgi:endonuclease/exonuclease/phosphatase (EEP) superfamily protein YafD
VAFLVRSWNLFHGNTKPRGKQAYLEEMVRLASADGPDVVLLQEVSPWALQDLGAWSGMQAFGDVAQRPRIGPLPSTASVGRALTSLNPGLFRSAFTGQANAVLLTPSAQVHEHEAIVLNPWRFRAEQARRLELGLVARLAWAEERRIAQVLRATFADGRSAVIANLHATSYPPDRRVADAELGVAVRFADFLAEPEDIVVVGGDFNLRETESKATRDLEFSPFGPGIDQILVRGAETSSAERWSDERRLLGTKLLSDHAPVEVRIQ